MNQALLCVVLGLLMAGILPSSILWLVWVGQTRNPRF